MAPPTPPTINSVTSGGGYFYISLTTTTASVISLTVIIKDASNTTTYVTQQDDCTNNTSGTWPLASSGTTYVMSVPQNATSSVPLVNANTYNITAFCATAAGGSSSTATYDFNPVVFNLDTSWFLTFSKLFTATGWRPAKSVLLQDLVRYH